MASRAPTPLAFGPALASDERTRPLLEAVIARSLGGDTSILAELGLDPRDVRGPLSVRYVVRPDRDPRGMPSVIVAVADAARGTAHEAEAR